MRSVDCDTHFLEPLRLWVEYADPAWRDAAPRLVADGGRLLLDVGGDLHPGSPTHAGFGSLYRPDGEVADGVCDLHAASVDPGRRLARLDRTGTEAEIIYPTAAMAGMHSIRDAEHAAAHARAYNRFAAAVTAAAPDRLCAAMIVPLNHPIAAERELRHAREHLGLGVLLASFVAPSPYALSDRELERVWAAAADLDVTVTFQDSSLTAAARTSGLARAQTWRMLYLAAHVVEAQLGLADIVLGGVLARHPTLRVGIAETHLRWISPWLSLLDDRFGARSDGGLPTQQFARQCFVAAFPDDAGARELIDSLGAENLVFASDWPHTSLADGNERDWVSTVSERSDLQPHEVRQALVVNPRRWFPVSAP
ncbi:MAG: amidohydrolase family protein [Ilumatobacteraceae bacterium]